MKTIRPIPQTALGYILTLRNVAKREYAKRYAFFLSRGSLGEAPGWSPLSYMAAQAVRMQLADLFDRETASN